MLDQAPWVPQFTDPNLYVYLELQAGRQVGEIAEIMIS